MANPSDINPDHLKLSSSSLDLSEYESYTDYLLSKNIAQILNTFSFQRIGTNALLLLTNRTKAHIESIAEKAKDYSELSGRLEVNIIDVLFSLLNNCNNNEYLTQEAIISYIKTSKLSSISKWKTENVLDKEREARAFLIKKLNSSNMKYPTKASPIPQQLLSSIPKHLRYFPREFALGFTENTFDKNNEFIKKKRIQIKNVEKKILEDIISSNSYYDMTKKQMRKKKESLDIISIFKELSKPVNIGSDDYKNERFGTRFKMWDVDDSGDNDQGEKNNVTLGNTNMNMGNNDINMIMD